jgi:hypothetical protein
MSGRLAAGNKKAPWQRRRLSNNYFSTTYKS